MGQIQENGTLALFRAPGCATIRAFIAIGSGKAGDMARQRAVDRSGGRLRVAVAQIEPVLGDLKANVSLHSDWSRRALRRGADLVVFPELSLTGYLLQDLVAEVALPLTAINARLRPLLDLSRRIAIVAGF